jgi:hypothetical protein
MSSTGFTVSEADWLTVAALVEVVGVSVPETVTLVGPKVTVGVPLMTQLAPLGATPKPAGNPGALQLASGNSPPVVVTVWLNGRPTVPFSNVNAFITSGGLMTSVNAGAEGSGKVRVLEGVAESVAVMRTLNVPETVGVPEITQVLPEATMVSPVGKPVAEQLLSGDPPPGNDAVMVALKLRPCVPSAPVNENVESKLKPFLTMI